MRDALPKNGPRKHETAIVNLDQAGGPETHWVAYRKINKDVLYFDSFGNLRLPAELLNYLGVSSVKHNHEKYQDYDTSNCGHLCLKFLYNTWNF